MSVIRADHCGPGSSFDRFEAGKQIVIVGMIVAVAVYSHFAQDSLTMPEDPYTYPKELGEAAEWLENELGLPHGFLTALPQADDWSFIIKAHALIEAAVTNQLAASIDPRLIPVFEQLELGDQRRGKIAFTKALGVLDNGQRKFIQFLSELRNDLVHNVRSVSFNINDHLSNLDFNQKSKFIDAITYFATNSKPYRSQAAEHPKETIWASTLLMLMLTTLQGSAQKREKEWLQSKARMLDQVIEAFNASKK